MKITGKIVVTLVVGLILLGFFATLISVLSLKKRGELEIKTAREMLLENKKAKLQDLVRNANTVLENAFMDAHNPEKVAAIYKKQLHNVVDVAYSVIESVYKDPQYATDEEKKQAASTIVKQMRYNQKDYFWINDMQPYMVMHPYKPALDGKDLSEFKDPKGKKLFVEFVNVCKANGDGFVDYMWPKPGADKPVPKLSYVKLFKPWNWIVGSGVYLEVAEQKLKDDAKKMIGKLRYGPEKKDYFWINDTHPNMVMHPYKPALNGKDLSDFKDPEGKFLFKEMVKVCEESGSGFVNYMWPKPGSDRPEPKLSYVQLFKQWNWIVGTGIYIDDIDSLMLAKKAEINSNIAAQIYQQIALVAVVGALLSIATLFFVKRKISHPLIQASEMLKDIAEGEGDLTKRLEALTKDETGDMAKWFNLFIDKLRQIVSDIARNTQTLISSSEALSSLSGQMDSSSDVMLSKSDTVASAADQLSFNINSVAATMEQAASNINIVATASEEMTATINEIARNTENAHNISDKAVSQTGNATGNIAELGQAAQGIGKITETISEISEQTNLLALNATIEAARAGEAGKGFAVVANEIKELAKQTADATSEIKKQIEGIQTSSSGTVTEIQEILKVINDVNEMISTISAAVEEQSVTTKEIAHNVAEASTEIQDANNSVSESSAFASDIASNISEVNQEASEIANSSAQLKKSAADLNFLAEELNNLVNTFKI